MTERYLHLTISKETLQNPRRTRDYNIPRTPRADLRQHAGMLLQQLNTIRTPISQVPGRSHDGRFILKLHYTGMLDFAHLNRHGIEFISQEDKQVCIAFSDEQGLAQFTEHLSQLGNVHVTYQQILETLDSIDVWAAEDRKSWAILHYLITHD